MMHVLTTIRKWVKTMLGRNDIETAMQIEPALSETMQQRIRHWKTCWAGQAPWLSEDVTSLRLEYAVVREFSNIALSEMTVQVDNERLDKLLQKARAGMDEGFQKGLATGALVMKPLGKTGVQFIPQNDFIPVAYDSEKRLVKVIFPEQLVRDGAYFTRLEYHDFEQGKGVRITNRAFRSQSADQLGREIPLTAVPEWADLETSVHYPTTQPIFGYYRNPLSNDTDNSPAGISVFAIALPTIRRADRQFGRVDWEYASGERAIHADQAALETTQAASGKAGFRLPETFKRLYRGLLNIDNGTDTLFQEFSPRLRGEEFLKGLDAYKRVIEFQVGLSYGDISDPQSVEKTAAEIRAAKNRKYDMVTAIQRNLQTCMEELVYAIAFHNAMTQTGYTVTCTFEDSIRTDPVEERKQDREDLANGTLRPEEYRAKWRGETLETALRNLPAGAEVLGDDLSILPHRNSDGGTA